MIKNEISQKFINTAKDTLNYLANHFDALTIVSSFAFAYILMQLQPEEKKTFNAAPEVTPLIQTYNQDTLPTIIRPELEELYACNYREERSSITDFIYQLSLPMQIRDDMYYHSDPWTVGQQANEYTLNSQEISAVFAVRSDEYTIEVPQGAVVKRLKFTTKPCDKDWVMATFPENNSLAYPLTLTIK